MRRDEIDRFGGERPILIAGPTASGKSDLALEISARKGGTIVNADALQVFANWRILTARPTPEDEELAPHRLYGHVPGDAAYSAGTWLREVEPLLREERPIIVGGTGLYFSALTEGLAEIPPIPPEIRARAVSKIEAEGSDALLSDIDADTLARIDRRNPARVRRAWEVRQATGRGLASFQDDTPAPALPLDRAETALLEADRDWLSERIERRFDAMLAQGALDEAAGNLEGWNPSMPSAKAIGARELVSHLRGEISLDEARLRALAATRRHAKRQRTWFSARMRDWNCVAVL